MGPFAFEPCLLGSDLPPKSGPQLGTIVTRVLVSFSPSNPKDCACVQRSRSLSKKTLIRSYVKLVRRNEAGVVRATLHRRLKTGDLEAALATGGGMAGGTAAAAGAWAPWIQRPML